MCCSVLWAGKGGSPIKGFLAALLTLTLLTLLMPITGISDPVWVTREYASLVQPGNLGVCTDHPSAAILLVYNDAWQYVDEGGHLFFSECRGCCTECGTVLWQDAGIAHYEAHAFGNGLCSCGCLQADCTPAVPADDVWHDDEIQVQSCAQERFFYFSDVAFDFGATLNKPVYTGPGTEYLRAAADKAQFVGRYFSCAGLDGDWLLVRCSVKGGVRCGFINVREYRSKLQHLPRLDFAYAGAVLIRNAQLWDSMMENDLGPLANLPLGTRATYLGTFVGDTMTLAYIETTVGHRKARGFVDPSCLQLDGGW